MVKILIPNTFWFLSSTTALTFAAVACVQSTAQAAADYSSAAKILTAPSQISATETGALAFKTSDWKSEIQPDGTQILTYLTPNKKTKKVPEARAAILRSKEGSLDSITSYTATPTEDSTTVFFTGKNLTAISLCEDKGGKEIGRVCVTATPKLCEAMKGSQVTPDVLKEMDSFEMRSLAILLTLRGPDHQLENVVKSGNRLGLKSALQTTKGQLLALARQIGRESGQSRSVASIDEATEKKLGIDTALSKSVLTESIPRLKKACTTF